MPGRNCNPERLRLPSQKPPQPPHQQLGKEGRLPVTRVSVHMSNIFIVQLTQTEPSLHVFNELGKTVTVLREPRPLPWRDPEWNCFCDPAGQVALISRSHSGD